MTQRSAPTQLRFPGEFGVDFDLDAFDDLILDKGVPLQHWRAMPCPVGRANQYDYRSPHVDHAGCSNGFLYREAGIIKAIYTGNSAQLIQVDLGLLTGSTVMLTFARLYDKTQQAFHAHPFDRFYLPDANVLVTGMELFEVSGLNNDRIKFPITEIIDLVDAKGEQYGPDDYKIVDGKILWTGQHRPGYDPTGSHGVTCSIRFLYRPYWLFKNYMHEVRVSQTEAFDGSRGLARLPQSGLLQRENVQQDESQDKQPVPGLRTDRTVQLPPQYGLGVR